MLCAKFSPFSPTKDRWVKGEAPHPPIEMRGQSFFTYILENLQSFRFLVLWANQNGSLHHPKKNKTKQKLVKHLTSNELKHEYTTLIHIYGYSTLLCPPC